jgi:uncharacterized protein YunC (DUF1805 family)
MTAYRVASALALTRAVLGAAGAVAPGPGFRLWVGGEADRPAVKVLARALAGRDLALGAGALLALRHGRGARGWLEASALADLTDLAATLIGWRRLPPGWRAVFVASSSAAAALGVTLAREDLRA